MKRCWFGGVLLLLVLISGMLLSRYMGDFHRDLSNQMTRSAQLAGENRSSAQALADDTRQRWEDRRWLMAIISDHSTMEEIEENFRLLTPEAEDSDFREICLRLSVRLKALGEGQMLSWENLF